jgi:uncharacterized protein with HEPN domain
MSRREWLLLVEDMLAAIQKIGMYLEGFDFESFRADSRTVDAVLRNLEVIGEAANALPSDVCDRAPSVDWRGVVGLRNRLIHEYFDVSSSTVWFIATRELPVLERQLQVLCSR